MNHVTGFTMPSRHIVAFPRWMLIATTVLSVLIGLASLRYFVPSIPPPPSIAANSFRYPWLLIHVASAVAALLLGPAQFFPKLRARFPLQHRWTGRAYVIGCTVGGVSGLPLAFGASTGWVSTLGFGMLAVAWLVTTLLAWRRAVQRRFVQHQDWMIRSFALTLAAVTLRLYLPIATVLPISYDDGYRAISFLCWVPNIILAELYLRRRHAPLPEA